MGPEKKMLAGVIGDEMEGEGVLFAADGKTGWPGSGKGPLWPVRFILIMGRERGSLGAVELGALPALPALLALLALPVVPCWNWDWDWGWPLGPTCCRSASKGRFCPDTVDEIEGVVCAVCAACAGSTWCCAAKGPLPVDMVG
jgi:hypothetical protein